jgi:hypothetical protein
MTTFTVEQDVFRRVCQVKWTFSAGSGLQEGNAFDARGWEIASAEFYTPSTYLPKTSIQISNETSNSAQFDVDGLVIPTDGVTNTPQMLKPSSSAITQAPAVRAVVDGVMAYDVSITVYFKMA